MLEIVDIYIDNDYHYLTTNPLTMKKGLFSILIAATILIPFALTGCGSSEVNSSGEEMHKGHNHDHHGHKH